jgi:hypothetical protein
MQKTVLRTAAIIVCIVALMALVEFSMGRRLWGTGGEPGLWSGDIWSEHNSQFLSDPYSFTHVTHGVVFYGLLSLAGKRVPISFRLIAAVALEAGWEVMENSDTVIERYRKATISLNYFGDSIANSMSDVVMCVLGFLLASRLPRKFTIAATVIVEIVLLIWIRDNLTLNILMLIRPLDAIRVWQLGK